MTDEHGDCIRIIEQKITTAELKRIAEERFGDLVKVVVDVNKKIMAIGGELHADEEAVLLKAGSRQDDLWGINLYPDLSGEAMIEFDSMINIRPRQGNRSRGVDDPSIRGIIISLVTSLVQ